MNDKSTLPYGTAWWNAVDSDPVLKRLQPKGMPLEMLRQRLAILRRQADGRWLDEQDDDGGISSRLGFRLIVDDDGHLRVMNAKSGEPYPRPDEAALKLRRVTAAYKKEVALRQRAEAELAELR